MGDPNDHGPPEEAPELAAALQRLRARKNKGVPYVQQLEAADCGAASLAMVLAYYGKSVALDVVRSATGSNGGTDAVNVLRAGRKFGLRGRVVQLEISSLHHLPPGSILHWGFNHFVVLERVRRDRVDLVDPAFGRRRLDMDRVRRHFTGVALVFEPDEDFEPTAPGRSNVWRYFTQLLAQRSLIGRVVITTLALRVLALALPVLTALVVDRVVPRGDASLLIAVLGGIGIALAFQVISSLIRAHLLIELRTRLDTKMTVGFLSHLLSLPYAFFTRRSAGDLLLRAGSISQIRELLTSTLLSTLLDGILALTYIVLLVFLSPLLSALTGLFGALQLVVLIVSRKRSAMLMAQDLESQARAQSYLVQILVGIETLKVSGAEHRALEQWTNLYVDELNVALSRSRLQAVVDATSSLLSAAGPLILLGTGAMLVVDGSLRLGTMLAATALAAGFLTPLSSLVASMLQLQMLGSYVERIDDVLAAEPEQARASALPPPDLSGAIELRGVSFRYGPVEPSVVREVSLSIEPGSMIAIVGRSGSGKSTLAALMLGLYRPTEGRILFDGHDLATLDHQLLRSQLGVVPQHPFVFSGSIRDNISLSDPTASMERVIAAARKACIDDDIRSMPMAYDTLVADSGSTLSGGQRQRLALARALLRNPNVILLDEATSSLDATSERAVMDNLRNLRATRIVIAHRLSTIVHADRILVMEDGQLVETGTHEELVAKEGPYALLIADQTFGANKESRC